MTAMPGMLGILLQWLLAPLTLGWEALGFLSLLLSLLQVRPLSQVQAQEKVPW
jgi:hypothetical protein